MDYESIKAKYPKLGQSKDLAALVETFKGEFHRPNPPIRLRDANAFVESLRPITDATTLLVNQKLKELKKSDRATELVKSARRSMYPKAVQDKIWGPARASHTHRLGRVYDTDGKRIFNTGVRLRIGKSSRDTEATQDDHEEEEDEEADGESCAMYDKLRSYLTTRDKSMLREKEQLLEGYFESSSVAKIGQFLRCTHRDSDVSDDTFADVAKFALSAWNKSQDEDSVSESIETLLAMCTERQSSVALRAALQSLTSDAFMAYSPTSELLDKLVTYVIQKKKTDLMQMLQKRYMLTPEVRARYLKQAVSSGRAGFVSPLLDKHYNKITQNPRRMHQLIVDAIHKKNVHLFRELVSRVDASVPYPYWEATVRQIVDEQLPQFLPVLWKYLNDKDIHQINFPAIFRKSCSSKDMTIELLLFFQPVTQTAIDLLERPNDIASRPICRDQLSQYALDPKGYIHLHRARRQTDDYQESSRAIHRRPSNPEDGKDIYTKPAYGPESRMYGPRRYRYDMPMQWGYDEFRSPSLNDYPLSYGLDDLDDMDDPVPFNRSFRRRSYDLF